MSQVKDDIDVVYQPLIESLEYLETNGVYVDNANFKAGVLSLCCDNLESHIVNGLSKSFSKGKYISRNFDLETNYTTPHVFFF